MFDKWIVDNKLTTISQQDQDKIFVIGNYETTNWSIDGLELKTITIPYYVSSDKTREDDTKDSLKIVDELFIGTNPLFKYPNNVSRGINSYGAFNFNIPPVDFDKFVKEDVSLQKIYEYITNKTTAFLAKQGITGNITWFNSNTFSTQARISNTPHLEIKKNMIFSTAYYVWRLNINGNAFGFSFKPRTLIGFNITSSADAIWPS